MGCFKMYECKDLLHLGHQTLTFQEAKKFWDAVAEAKKETVGFGKQPSNQKPTDDHRELLWWFGKNGWSDIMLATAPDMTVNVMFRHIIQHAENSVSAAGDGSRENSPHVISVFVLRPYEKYSNFMERWMKRTLREALFRIGIPWERQLLNEEEEVPKFVPYIPITDEHLHMLGGDCKYFPTDEIDRYKEIILEKYTQETILCDRDLQRRCIDREIVRERERSRSRKARRSLLGRRSFLMGWQSITSLPLVSYLVKQFMARHGKIQRIGESGYPQKEEDKDNGLLLLPPPPPVAEGADN